MGIFTPITRISIVANEIKIYVSLQNSQELSSHNTTSPVNKMSVYKIKLGSYLTSSVKALDHLCIEPHLPTATFLTRPQIALNSPGSLKNMVGTFIFS